MPVESDKLFWKKKEFISFLLCILVFFIHANFAKEITSDRFVSVLNYKVSYFFANSITRFAVPMFFTISGITFFKDYDNKKYLGKVKSRVFTLIIPYLLWNTIWMLWEIFTSHSFLAKFSENNTPYPLNLSSILKGIFFYGCNVPFWFIFDLIIFSLAAPILFLLIKNKYVGIISVVILTALAFFGIYLPESVFYYPTAIIFYIAGGIIGHHFFGYACKSSSKPLRIFSLVFLVAYVLAKNIAPIHIHIDNYFVQTVIFSLAAFSLWNVTDIFIERVKLKPFHRRSFAVYAMHLPIMIVILKILSFCTPKNEWLEIPKFVIIIVLTLVIINLVCAFLEKFAPRVNAVLMGNRMKKR